MRKNPDAIVYDPASKRVFTGNGGSGTVTAIDAATIPSSVMSRCLAGPSSAPRATAMVYFNIEDKNEVVAIDARKNTLVSTWPLGTCDGPSGLSMDVAHHRLFSGCHNKVMMVVNSDNAPIVATLPIGRARTPRRSIRRAARVQSRTATGTLTVAHEDSPGAIAVVQKCDDASGSAHPRGRRQHA